MPRPFFLFVCCIAFGVLPGQELQLSFHHLDQEDGLPHAGQYFFSHGSRGFTWIGTDGGLCRFDGKALMRYSHDPADPTSISENLITSTCFEDAEGNLWFTTFGAVQCLQRSTGGFQSWVLPASGQKGYRAFHLEAGKLWLRVGGDVDAGLYLFDVAEKTFQRKGVVEGMRCTVWGGANGRPSHLIETTLPNRAGFVWRSLENAGAVHLDFQKKKDGKERKFASPTNNALADGDSIIWFCLYDGLGVFYPKDGRHWIELDRSPNVPNDLGWVHSIVPLDGQRLLATCNYGLVIFDKKQRAFTQLISPSPSDPLGLKTATYEELFLDPTGNVWAERDGQGVTFANLRKRKFLVIPLLAGKEVISIFEDSQGYLWCSTESDGTFVFDSGKKLLKHLKTLDNRAMQDEDFALPPLTALFEDNTGNLWGTNSNNLLFWDKTGSIFRFIFPHYFLGVPSTDDDNLNHLLQLPDGAMLAARGSNVFRLNTTPERVTLAPWHNLDSYGLQTITALFQDKKGRIYIADQAERLLIFSERNEKWQLVAEMANIGVCYGFLEMGDSIVWGATSDGLLKIGTETWQHRLLNEAKDSLPNEVFYKVLSDKSGKLWLSGPNGLIRYDPASKSFHRFGKADGLASNGSNANAFLKSSNGEFWLGSKNGLNVIRPEQIALLSDSPPVYITQIYVNDTLFTQKTKGETTSLVLGYRHNTLSFRFAALDFSDPGSNQFYYRLRGFEEEWVYNGNEGFVRYPNLPPGNYIFEVKASNSDGVLSSNITSLALFIRPPFWKTWWFYLLCSLFAIGLLRAWIQYRLQQALKMERLRVKISSDLHDEVGTLLSGLAMQSEVLELTARQQDKPRLHRIAELSRNAMLSMRDTVWAIDARKDKLENLLDRMREYAAEILIPRDFQFDLKVENLDLRKNLPVDVRQNLYLIFKEAITNIAKHSNGNEVLVSLIRTGEGMEMHIYDNGHAIEKSHKPTGLGLSNMQMRAQRLGGTLSIETQQGFSVTVRLKLLRS